jgi:FkbM family methyltransferase
MEVIKNIVNSTLKRFDRRLIRNSYIVQLEDMLTFSGKSHSQIKQDIFILSQTGFKRHGFFVEFGATDGIFLSNTYLLEREFGWTGILAEPATRWHRALHENRQCFIDTKCVWRDTGGILPFNEVEDGELSTISQYSDGDVHKEARKRGKIYDVETISLLDLLNKYNAPKNIDFLSIDTEGSEFEILSTFDFDQYSFSFIVCEHGFTESRPKVQALLKSRGYQRVFESLSMWDDWYRRC